ncbi:RhuM family protein [Methanobrevibacter woesei]|uniref:RhuM family protein n=1 Tax=Methanobrevibacter woesei TaxID=190976 RepID=UPI0039F57CB3
MKEQTILKKYMGLTTWNNAPDGKIFKSDIIVAKNYLDEEELSELNNIVNMYLDYAENQARRHKLMIMEDWAIKLDKFLEFNEYEKIKNYESLIMDIDSRLRRIEEIDNFTENDFN